MRSRNLLAGGEGGRKVAQRGETRMLLRHRRNRRKYRSVFWLLILGALAISLARPHEPHLSPRMTPSHDAPRHPHNAPTHSLLRYATKILSHGDYGDAWLNNREVLD